MRRTIADELKEEGAIKKSQQTLIRQLKRRFRDVPDELSSTIRATSDPEQLDAWLDHVVTAETLEEIGIEVPAQRALVRAGLGTFLSSPLSGSSVGNSRLTLPRQAWSARR